MLVEIQAINYILKTKDIGFLRGIDPSYFGGLSPEVTFIQNHISQYGVVPDLTTFQSAYPKFPVQDVGESPKAIKDGLVESAIYRDLEPCIKVFSNKLQTNSIEATKYLMEKMNIIQQQRQIHTTVGVDIVAQANERWESYEKRRTCPEEVQLNLGIPELDLVGGGLVRGAMSILFARTNKGKSWVAMYVGLQAWLQKKKVLFYAGEMSPIAMGFRFDTFLSHISNKGMFFGNANIREEYKQHIDSLNGKSGFIIVTPSDFGGKKPTVNQLREKVEELEADVLIVDQLSLLADQQGGRDRTQRYGNIAEDMKLMVEDAHIYALLLAQAGRKAEEDKEAKEGTPKLEHLEYADLVCQTAPNIIAMNVVGGILKLNLRKNRMGQKDVEALLKWDIDTGVIEPLLSREVLQATAEDYGF